VKYKIFLDVYGKILKVPDELSPSLKKQYDARLARSLEYLNSPYINYFNSTNSPDRALAKYKTFINLSLSEMLCTSTAEALAMGKFAILPDHPSNHFFKQFKNALFYQNEEEAIRLIRKTETSEPEEDPAIVQLHWSQGNKRLLSIINDNL
jgi:glycosyltransferase involved in cell wall biosynthesis